VNGFPFFILINFIGLLVPREGQRESFFKTDQLFELQVGQVARMGFAMQIGNVSETVQVKAQAPLLQSETTEIGAVIENKRIVHLRTSLSPHGRSGSSMRAGFNQMEYLDISGSTKTLD
jgi:hypothetical protein